MGKATNIDKEAVRRYGEQVRGLSIRAVNCLLNKLDTLDKDTVRAAVLDGRVHPHRAQSKMRNYGWKSHREVLRWLGMPEPDKKGRYLACPHCGGSVVCRGRDLLKA